MPVLYCSIRWLLGKLNLRRKDFDLRNAAQPLNLSLAEYDAAVASKDRANKHGHACIHFTKARLWIMR